MDNSSSNIILIDDHSLFVSAIKELFEVLLPSTNIFIFTDAFKARHFLKSKSVSVDLILLDLTLKNANGFEVMKRLRSEFPNTPVALLTASEEVKDVRKCFKLGGQGFISKSLSPEATIQAVNLMLSGEKYIPSFFLSQSASSKLRFNDNRLTARQAEVLEELKLGAPNKLIAKNLGITEGTVKIHVSAILKLFKLKNRTEVAINL